LFLFLGEELPSPALLAAEGIPAIMLLFPREYLRNRGDIPE
jgi:hypothetical protein